MRALFPPPPPKENIRKHYLDSRSFIRLLQKICFLLPSFSNKFLLAVRRTTVVRVRPCSRSLENAMISDPNIPETGEQAARALHGINDDECCFYGCFKNNKEDLCPKCTEPWNHGKVHDQATAPQCESPPQSGSTGRREIRTPKKSAGD